MSDNQVYQRANQESFEAYIMLIRLRWDLFGRWRDTGEWPNDPEANTALGGHSRYWQQQLAAGRAVLGGGMKGDFWDNTAVIIFEASSEEEANEIVANDPAVKAYVFQAQVRPFQVHFISNKFQVKATESAS